jgi:hypothetical protein
MAGEMGQTIDSYSNYVLELLRQLRRAERERLSAPRGSAERRAAERNVDDLELKLRMAAERVLPPRGPQ